MRGGLDRIGALLVGRRVRAGLVALGGRLVVVDEILVYRDDLFASSHLGQVH